MYLLLAKTIPEWETHPTHGGTELSKTEEETQAKNVKKELAFGMESKFTNGIEVQWHGIGTYFACNDILV